MNSNLTQPETNLENPKANQLNTNQAGQTTNDQPHPRYTNVTIPRCTNPTGTISNLAYIPCNCGNPNCINCISQFTLKKVLMEYGLAQDVFTTTFDDYKAWRKFSKNEVYNTIKNHPQFGIEFSLYRQTNTNGSVFVAFRSNFTTISDDLFIPMLSIEGLEAKLREMSLLNKLTTKYNFHREYHNKGLTASDRKDKDEAVYDQICGHYTDDQGKVTFLYDIITSKANDSRNSLIGKSKTLGGHGSNDPNFGTKKVKALFNGVQYAQHTGDFVKLYSSLVNKDQRREIQILAAKKFYAALDNNDLNLNFETFSTLTSILTECTIEAYEEITGYEPELKSRTLVAIESDLEKTISRIMRLSGDFITTTTTDDLIAHIAAKYKINDRHADYIYHWIITDEQRLGVEALPDEAPKLYKFITNSFYPKTDQPRH